jgi:hypothetical protein
MVNRTQSRTAFNQADASKLRPDQRLACRRLAIEVFRSYDQQLLNPKSSPVVRQKALRRLQAALPSLTEFLNDHLLDVHERAYVSDLVQRLLSNAGQVSNIN